MKRRPKNRSSKVRFPTENIDEKNQYKLAVTVPKAPTFSTDKRIGKTQAKSSEEIELEKIENLKQLLLQQKKSNKETIQGLKQYHKPLMKKKENTVVKEFKLTTDKRSVKHSQFRKQNLEKLQKEEELQKIQLDEKKKLQEEQTKKALKYYNKAAALKSNKSTDQAGKNSFVSLKNQVNSALMREDAEVPKFESPTRRPKEIQLTTPRSPPLSVKKRGEFSSKTKMIKTTEQLEMEEMRRNEFKATLMPKQIFAAYKPITGNTPKKTTFKEFNLSQTPKKQMFTSEELELLNNPKNFKARELDPKLLTKKVQKLATSRIQKVTEAKEFKFKTTTRKRDKKAAEKENENSEKSAKKRFAKPNTAPCLSTSKRARQVEVPKIN